MRALSSMRFVKLAMCQSVLQFTDLAGFFPKVAFSIVASELFSQQKLSRVAGRVPVSNGYA